MNASILPCHLVPVGLTLLAVLVGCQAVPSVTAQPSQAASSAEASAPGSTDAVLAVVPPCSDGVTATLTHGMVVRYQGADPNDPEVCVVEWQSRAHRYLAGFWSGGRFRNATQEERTAIRQALTGPVGTKASFEDTRADLWGRVTVEHVASPGLPVKGGLRRTVQLQVVRHDAHGRPNVRRETLHWIDVQTGIALKQQTVTRLSSGERQVHTTWQVQQLLDATS